MKLVPLERFGPAPLHEPLGYPGATPDASFVFTPEGVIQLADADPLSEAQAVLRRLGSAPIEERLPILCAGSNANPPQVFEKIRGGGEDQSVAFLLADVPNVQAVFSAHIGTYGVVPATLDEAPGATRTFFIGFYTRPQLPSLIASEHGNYLLSTLSSAAMLIRPRTRVPICNFFLSRKGVLVPSGDEPIPLDRYSQREILGLLFEELGRTEKLVARESLPPLADYLASPRQLGPVLAQAIERAGFWRPHRLDVEPVEPGELQPVRPH